MDLEGCSLSPWGDFGIEALVTKVTASAGRAD